ncbi:putative retrotransposon hot spot (RHS) protein [Trypanosoma grayi]|uniref:putative retrotransposon hot spot (RHS) protein n=1 Tax=Trypanosoma grayi TaxID=71804 RepID=UPI0004F44647|nr:putative retrotransposon hot spot (RHS) protein [Trypanosoma grayi]KEG14124.1 putative retrotransposon hot spot (RHS) protein [Trypanosoma grayi]
MGFSNDVIAAERALRMLRSASWLVVGGYGVALCYRFGLFSKVLPKAAVDTVEGVVEKIKARTEPLGDVSRYAAARSHLVRVYSLSALGMLTAAVGGAVFFAFPKVPIAVPVALTLVPSVVLFLVPREMMLPVGRLACLFTSCFAFGYSFGPIGWIAWDSLAIFLTLLASTMAGLCVPLFLTRGMVSYVLSSQLLSCTLSLAAVTTTPLVMAAATAAATGSGSTNISKSSLDILRRADVNVLITMQLISNWGINLLHTIPVIIHFVRWEGTKEELILSVDPVKESMCICAGAAYVMWRSFRWACRRLILTVATDGAKDASEKVHEKWGDSSSSPLPMQNVSGVGASLLLVLWYVRAVSALQRGETLAILDNLRCVCARASPVSMLVGSV